MRSQNISLGLGKSLNVKDTFFDFIGKIISICIAIIVAHRCQWQIKDLLVFDHFVKGNFLFTRLRRYKLY